MSPKIYPALNTVSHPNFKNDLTETTSAFAFLSMFRVMLICISLSLIGHCVTSSYGWRCFQCNTVDGLNFRLGRLKSRSAVLTNDKGDIYRGEVRANLPEGRGFLERGRLSQEPNTNGLLAPIRTGTRYEGYMRRAKDWPTRHGSGILYFPEGFIVEASWKDGVPEGPGTIVFPDGSRYSGNFHFVLHLGWTLCLTGDCTDADGISMDFEVSTVYVGRFSNDQHHGAGVKFKRQWVRDAYVVGLIFAGQFHKNVMISGTIYCVRSLRECQNLIVSARQNPEIRIDWADRIDFFADPLRPTLTEFETTAQLLLEQESVD